MIIYCIFCYIGVWKISVSVNIPAVNKYHKNWLLENGDKRNDKRGRDNIEGWMLIGVNNLTEWFSKLIIDWSDWLIDDDDQQRKKEMKESNWVIVIVTTHN